MIIEVVAIMPWAPEPVRVRVDVSESVCRDSFAPLPAGREIPWELHARQEADRIRAQRLELADYLSRTLAHALIQAVESRDPQHGYSPEEWAQLNREREK